MIRGKLHTVDHVQTLSTRLAIGLARTRSQNVRVHMYIKALLIFNTRLILVLQLLRLMTLHNYVETS